MWLRIGGRDVGEPMLASDLSPLLYRGLPPKLVPHQAPEIDVRIGNISSGFSGTMYGDASGVGRRRAAPESITWSLVTERGEHGSTSRQQMAGSCGGWFPTVPRGELRALKEWLDVARSPALFYSDCQFVVDGAQRGVPQQLTSSRSEHADLWRSIKAALRDRGPGVEVRKVKAHRSQSAAALEDGDDTIWAGNDAADSAAKSLAKGFWEAASPQRARRDEEREGFTRSLVHSAICVSLSHRQLDALGLPRVGRLRRRTVRTNDGWKCGDHRLEKRDDGGGWWCGLCQLIANTPSSRKSLMNKPCKGSVSQRIHHSHSVRSTSGVLWCARCGAYTSRLPRTLRELCKGAPPSAAARNVLRRLRAGLPPTTAAIHQRQQHAWKEQVAFAFAALHRPVPSEDQGSERISRRPECTGGQGAERQREPVYVRSSSARSSQDPITSATTPSPSSPTPFARTTASTSTHATPMTSSGSAAPIGRQAVPAHREYSETDEAPLSSLPAFSVAAPSRPERQMVQAAPQTSWCEPTSTSSWSRRIQTASMAARGKCHLCQAITASICRGCSASFCIACARARRACRPSGPCPALAAVADSGACQHQRQLQGNPEAGPVAGPEAGFNHHYHHHHGDSVDSTPLVPTVSHAFLNDANKQPSTLKTLQEDEAKQHTVLVAAPLSSSVSPCLQVLPRPVGVAAAAAFLSDINGHPPLHARRHADCRDVDPSKSSSAAAVLPSSCIRVHIQGSASQDC